MIDQQQNKLTNTTNNKEQKNGSDEVDEETMIRETEDMVFTKDVWQTQITGLKRNNQ